MAVAKPVLVVAGGCLALGLAGCGSSSVAHVAAGQSSAVPPPSPPQPVPTTTTTSAPATATTAGPSASTAPVPPGWKPVTYQSVRFAVPGDWLVYNLTTDPNRCVELDIHAVYLGHAGPHPACPATALGKTDAMHVEPLDSQSRPQVVLSPAPTTVAGQPALIDPSSATTRNIVVALEQSAVLVTLSYNSSPALDQSILATFQANK